MVKDRTREIIKEDELRMIWLETTEYTEEFKSKKMLMSEIKFIFIVLN